MKTEDAITGAVVVAGVIGFITGMALLNGLVIACLWDWYVVPLGVVRIGIIHAVGISLVFQTLRGYQSSQKDDDWKSTLSGAISFPLVAILFGWIVHFWM